MNYQRMYAYLVGTMDRALDLLEEGDPVKAKPIRELLHNALLQAEEAYIDSPESDSFPGHTKGQG